MTDVAPKGSGDRQQDGMVIVARADSEALAQILVDKLIQDGVPAMYSGSSLGFSAGQTPWVRLTGYPIHVPKAHATRAREILVEERAGALIVADRPQLRSLMSAPFVAGTLLLAAVLAAVLLMVVK